jgi:hypothetical protein
MWSSWLPFSKWVLPESPLILMLFPSTDLHLVPTYKQIPTCPCFIWNWAQFLFAYCNSFWTKSVTTFNYCPVDFNTVICFNLKMSSESSGVKGLVVSWQVFSWWDHEGSNFTKGFTHSELNRLLGGGNWRGRGTPLKGLCCPWTFPLCLCFPAAIWWTALLHHIFYTMIFYYASGPKQQNQQIMNWNHGPK